MMAALLVALMASQFTPAEAQALFVEANDAYYQQDYPRAVEKYERLLDAGFSGADVLFNLGTTHLAAGQLGAAVVFLERARRFKNDDDIEANLAVARQRQVDQVIGADSGQPFFERLASALSEPLVSTGFLVSWYVAFCALWVFRRRTSGRTLWGLLVGFAFLISISLLGLVTVQHWVRTHIAEAVIIHDTVRVREFPGEGAKAAFEVHAGLKVRVLERSGKYARIRLPNALEGWAEEEALSDL